MRKQHRRECRAMSDDIPDDVYDSDYWEVIPYRIDGAAITLVFGLHRDGWPSLIYIGARLPDDEDLHALQIATAPRRHGSQPDVPALAAIWPQSGRGCLGMPAMTLRRGDRSLPFDLVVTQEASDASRLSLQMDDASAGVRVSIEWAIGGGDVTSAHTTLTNTGNTPLAVDRIASIVLPMPAWAGHATRFHGRWAGEMHEDAGPIPCGQTGGASRGGRPGFGGANWIIAHDASFGVDHGRGIALHLAWSGDHETLIERDADGASMQIGVRLDAGEITLAPGESFTTPDAVLAFTGSGRNGTRRAFHTHLRSEILPDRSRWPARRVHLNSWEAVAFDMDESRLARLAEAGAAIGVERFVVDDGWFAGRADDRTSLGDWNVDPGRFRNGLDQLIDYVGKHHMDFGLWVEPEMISPDSALYRAHPDWCLHRADADRPTQRHQLVLDLARPEVSDHLFGQLDTLLRSHRIAYLKWDHNRDLFPNDGAGYRQTQAFYTLLDRLRAAHPIVEIESCASGGGRIDYGVLRRCHRVWPSDNNDAVERLRINRAWSLFLPLEVMGNHVGPSPNPITGRALSMDFRAKVAMFGHMGVEADPAAMTAEDRDVLAAHIDCYKRHRDLLRSGEMRELAFDEPGLFGTMVGNRGRALAIVARIDSSIDYNAAPIRFPGLDPAMRYVVTLPVRDIENAPNPVGNWALSGRMLADAGIVLPLARPGTAWLIAFEAMGVPT